MIKIGIMMSAVPKVMKRLSDLGMLQNSRVFILHPTVDEVTRVDLLEEGVHSAVLQYGVIDKDWQKLEVQVFRGMPHVTELAIAQFCRDEEIQVVYDTTQRFLISVAPDTTVLVVR